MDRSVTCKSIVGDNNAQYFLLVDWGQNDFNITVTDCKSCWSKKGATAPPTYFLTVPVWWAQAHRALAVPAPSDEFTYEAEQQGSDLVLRWMWWAATANCKAKAKLELSSCEDMPDALRAMMTELCASYVSFKSTMCELERHRDSLARELADTRKQLEEAVTAQRAREEELFVKFAILLNEKKRKLREMQQQLQQQRMLKLEAPLKHEANGTVGADSGVKSEDDASSMDTEEEEEQERKRRRTSDSEASDSEGGREAVQPVEPAGNAAARNAAHMGDDAVMEIPKEYEVIDLEAGSARDAAEEQEPPPLWLSMPTLPLDIPPPIPRPTTPATSTAVPSSHSPAPDKGPGGLDPRGNHRAAGEPGPGPGSELVRAGALGAEDGVVGVLDPGARRGAGGGPELGAGTKMGGAGMAGGLEAGTSSRSTAGERTVRGDASLAAGVSELSGTLLERELQTAEEHPDPLGLEKLVSSAALDADGMVIRPRARPGRKRG